jgi:hypothetical protein
VQFVAAYRKNENDVTNRVDVENPTVVRDAVCATLAARYPGADLSPLTVAFEDVGRLFLGRFPGYEACDTLYHDMRHTLDMTLAMTRLVDGHDRVCGEADQLGPRRAMLGILIALLHDSGYLKRKSEASVENGAIFTKVHVSRSADLLAAYLPQLGLGEDAQAASRLVHYTGYEMPIEDIPVRNEKDQLLGCMVGTADLIGQMSDRMYLEKVRRFLYDEFVWAKIAREELPDGREIVRYASAEDLIIKTPGFYEYVARDRINKKLDSADRYAEAHFGGENLYQQAIDSNMQFLKETIATADFSRLRRTCYSLSDPARRMTHAGMHGEEPVRGAA